MEAISDNSPPANPSPPVSNRTASDFYERAFDDPDLSLENWAWFTLGWVAKRIPVEIQVSTWLRFLPCDRPGPVAFDAYLLRNALLRIHSRVHPNLYPRIEADIHAMDAWERLFRESGSVWNGEVEKEANFLCRQIRQSIAALEHGPHRCNGWFSLGSALGECSIAPDLTSTDGFQRLRKLARICGTVFDKPSAVPSGLNGIASVVAAGEISQQTISDVVWKLQHHGDSPEDAAEDEISTASAIELIAEEIELRLLTGIPGLPDGPTKSKAEVETAGIALSAVVVDPDEHDKPRLGADDYLYFRSYRWKKPVKPFKSTVMRPIFEAFQAEGWPATINLPKSFHSQKIRDSFCNFQKGEENPPLWFSVEALNTSPQADRFVRIHWKFNPNQTGSG